MSDSTLVLSPEEFVKFRDFIYERSGIYFAETKKYLLESRLGNRLALLKLRSVDDYYLFLRYDPKGKSETELLFSEVTINETSFFRTMPQLDMFRDLLVPECQRARGPGRQLRIWSAACASGEEPYTLAMILREKMSVTSPYIFANDISPKVLGQARRGQYSDHVLRSTPREFRDKYFRALDSGLFEIAEEIRRSVIFEQANLAETAHLSRVRDMDVIMCRNVLIYFDLHAKKKVVESFYTSLRKGGYLVIGPSEALFNVSRAFRLIHHNKAVVYQKE